MKHLDLFSGIGGFALATEMVWNDVQHEFCDNEPFSQAILKKHWPQSIIHDDIKTLTGDGTSHPVDLVTGGFPCQPFSSAGKRRGTDDDRHLWPEMLRVIREFSPRWVIGENVGGLLTWNGGLVLDQVCVDLEAAGYEVSPVVIPAAPVGAPHRRDRVWIIAHTLSVGPCGGNTRVDESKSKPERIPERHEMEFSGVAGPIRDGTNTPHERLQGSQRSSNSEGKKSDDKFVNGRSGAGYSTTSSDSDGNGGWPKIEGRKKKVGASFGGGDWSTHWIEVATRLCRMDDGLPRRMDRADRLRAIGNAIVPQVAAQIMRHIRDIDPLMR